MSDRDLQSVSATTGQFPALNRIVRTTDGSKVPESGKNLPPREEKQPDLAELAKKLNLASESMGRDLRFEVDLKKNRAVIQVLDSETGEIIRQIPPEKAEIYLSGDGKAALRLFDASV